MPSIVCLLGIAWLCLLLAIACQPELSPPPPPTPNPPPTTLQRVQQRGRVICGVNGRLKGFSYLDASGKWSGMEIDLCAAIAAAVLGKPTAITLRPIPPTDRFTSLKRGEIDVLFRDTAWTLSRSADPELSFAPVYFYDHQGILVKRGQGSFSDLNNQNLCSEAGDSQQQLASFLQSLRLKVNILAFPDSGIALDQFQRGGCVAISLNRSQLQSWQRQQANPNNWRILPLSFGREPFAPVVASRDPQWHRIVSWVIFALIYAEEQGISQSNFRQYQNNNNPEIARFLGTSGDLALRLGLPPDWTTQILQAVGNYQEIYNRHLPDLPRQLNRTQANGGLLYSMPFR
ncbi:MAG: transporter substrate-binding domain-containing protein [Pseudanabaenaceae cyanobacterium]